MDRRILAVAAAALVVGLVLMVGLAPDTGPPVEPVAPVVVTVPKAVRLPRPQGIPTEELVDDADEAILPEPRRPSPLPPIDPNQVHAVDLNGVASAAVSRRDRFQACWDEHQVSKDDYHGRLTVQITVSADGERGVATTDIVNGPENPGFHDCVGGVLGDVKFERPEHDFSMMWPLPIRTE